MLLKRNWILEKSNFKNVLIILFTLNFTDILLTLWQIELWGLDIEANLLMRHLISELGNVGISIFKLVIGLLVCIYLWFRYNQSEEVVGKNVNKIRITLGIVMLFYIVVNLIHIFNLSFYYIYSLML